VSLLIDDLPQDVRGGSSRLDGLTFEVPAGQIFGFLGANGAGKTTTMRIAIGVLAGERGPDRVGRQRTPAPLPRATWGYLPEEARAVSADDRARPARLLSPPCTASPRDNRQAKTPFTGSIACA